MSEPRTILRFEIRVEQSMCDRVEKALATAGLSAYTCIADVCAECHEEADECICD